MISVASLTLRRAICNIGGQGEKSTARKYSGLPSTLGTSKNVLIRDVGTRTRNKAKDTLLLSPLEPSGNSEGYSVCTGTG